MLGLAVLLAVLGAVIGSFVSVVAYRVPRKESFVAGRSRCPECKAQIAAYDNIPIVSYLTLRGRCRRCGARISPRYPASTVPGALTTVSPCFAASRQHA